MRSEQLSFSNTRPLAAWTVAYRAHTNQTKGSGSTPPHLTLVVVQSSTFDSWLMSNAAS